MSVIQLKTFWQRTQDDLKGFLTLMEKGQNKDMQSDYLLQYLSPEATDEYQ
jgi:hypothetical protein